MCDKEKKGYLEQECPMPECRYRCRVNRENEEDRDVCEHYSHYSEDLDTIIFIAVTPE